MLPQTPSLIFVIAIVLPSIVLAFKGFRNLSRVDASSSRVDAFIEQNTVILNTLAEINRKLNESYRASEISRVLTALSSHWSGAYLKAGIQEAMAAGLIEPKPEATTKQMVGYVALYIDGPPRG